MKVEIEKLTPGMVILIAGERREVQRVTPMTEGEVRIDFNAGGWYSAYKWTKFEVIS